MKILIVAYMHTGSTYLGSVLHNHPGVYYEFEPLRSLEASYMNEKPLVFLSGTVRYIVTFYCVFLSFYQSFILLSFHNPCVRPSMRPSNLSVI